MSARAMGAILAYILRYTTKQREGLSRMRGQDGQKYAADKFARIVLPVIEDTEFAASPR
jgi:hypothetical protein